MSLWISKLRLLNTNSSAMYRTWKKPSDKSKRPHHKAVARDVVEVGGEGSGHSQALLRDGDSSHAHCVVNQIQGHSASAVANSCCCGCGLQ
jgi:hypothetical protein